MGIGAGSNGGADQLMADIRYRLSGAYVRDLIRRCQVNIEALRPLPIRFESSLDLAVDLQDLIDLAFIPLRYRKESVAVKVRKVTHEKNLAALVENRAPMMEGQLAINIGGSPTGWINAAQKQSRDLHMNRIDRIITDELGGGDVIVGWKRALSMASNGTGGGIRRLRHMVLANRIRFFVVVYADSILAETLDMEADESSKCYELIREIISESLGDEREVHSIVLKLQWDRVVGGYLRALADSLIPYELA